MYVCVFVCVCKKPALKCVLIVLPFASSPPISVIIFVFQVFDFVAADNVSVPLTATVLALWLIGVH